MKKNVLRKNLLCTFTFIVAILFLYTFNETSSRYLGSLTSNEEVVAIPILNLSNNTLTYTIDNMKPGDTSEYEFTVSNKENGQLNEILLEYYFVIAMDNKLPLQVKLYSVSASGEQELTINENRTNVESMPYDIETTRNYKIKIIWPEEENDISYANQNMNLAVTLRGEQYIG